MFPRQQYPNYNLFLMSLYCTNDKVQLVPDAKHKVKAPMQFNPILAPIAISWQQCSVQLSIPFSTRLLGLIFFPGSAWSQVSRTKLDFPLLGSMIDSTSQCSLDCLWPRHGPALMGGAHRSHNTAVDRGTHLHEGGHMRSDRVLRHPSSVHDTRPVLR